MESPGKVVETETRSGRQVPLPILRLATRTAVHFLLDASLYAASGRDFTDNLILLAITQANVSPVIADPELQRRYATADSPPPAELRRPISINAVAASLHLPFETVRRRVTHLAEKGACEITPRGLVVPERMLSSQDHLSVLETNYAAVKDLYLQLRSQDCLPAPDLSQAPPAPAAPPIRAVARVSSDLVLRLVDPVLATAGSLADGFTLLAVFDLNTRAFTDADRGDDRLGPEGFVSDEARRPASVRAVAERLGLPYEQTRRRLAALTAQERCSRRGDGYLLTASDLARTHMMRSYGNAYVSLLRMSASLGEVGVLADWEAELAAGGRS